MIDTQLKTLINELVQKTKDKKVRWNRTSSESKFKLILQNKSALTVDSWEDEHNNDGVATVVIFNERGDEILVHKSHLNEDFEDFKLIYDLQNAARNAYFKVDETIASFLSEIGNTNEIGIEEKLPPITSTQISTDDDDLPF